MAAEVLQPLYYPVDPSSNQLPPGYKHEPWCPMFIKFPSTKLWAHIQSEQNKSAPISTYINDYIKYPFSSKPKLIYPSDNLELAGTEFAKSSNYRDTYIKHKPEKVEKRIPQTTLAFEGAQNFNSLYRDEYCPKQPIPPEKMPKRPAWRKPPKFTDITNYTNDYRRFSDSECSEARRDLIKPPPNLGKYEHLGPTKSTAQDSYIHHKGHQRSDKFVPKENGLLLDGPVDGTTTYYVDYCLPDRFKREPGLEPGRLRPENIKGMMKPYCICKKHLFNVGVERVDLPRPENTTTFFQKYGKMSSSTETRDNYCNCTNSATEMPKRFKPEDNAEFFRLGGQMAKKSSYKMDYFEENSQAGDLPHTFRPLKAKPKVMQFDDWNKLRQKKDVSRAGLVAGPRPRTVNKPPSYSTPYTNQKCEIILKGMRKVVNPSLRSLSEVPKPGLFCPAPPFVSVRPGPERRPTITDKELGQCSSRPNFVWAVR